MDLPSKKMYKVGMLVWGKLKGYTWWPAQVIHHYECGRSEAPMSHMRWVKWFAEKRFSLLEVDNLSPYQEFNRHFNENYYKKAALYRRAVFEVNMVAAKRSKKQLTATIPEAVLSGKIPKTADDKGKCAAASGELLEWVRQGFLPHGPEAIAPTPEEQQIPSAPLLAPPPLMTIQERTKPSTSASCRKSPSKISSFYEDHRDLRLKDMRKGRLTIKEVCIGCGELTTTAQHPLFEGGLCEECRVELIEVAYLFDTDGYQSYCSVCAKGRALVLCGQPGCGRSFCLDCLDLLVAPGESNKVINQDPWECYMCSTNSKHGFLVRRSDWSEHLLRFFEDDNKARFRPLCIYPEIPVADRKPIRVLSLFDGIGTGILALKELGFNVDCYYASEINKDAITVSSIHHKGTIQHIGDITAIDSCKLESLGQIDLLIGGTPYIDLSILNPHGRGVHGYDGTGRMFFDFHRIYKCLHPHPTDIRPFFWLYENVVYMGHEDKLTISRFLECHPVIIDAKDLSPAHSVRYFWGNIPGMSRPSVAAADNPLNLQDVLERHCNRQALAPKVRAIPTWSTSIKRKGQIPPVLMNGQEDTLWCTEMERVFGFPDHYTDVANLTRAKRHQLLERAWSVPVLKHLLAPLRNHFQCETRESGS